MRIVVVSATGNVGTAEATGFRPILTDAAGNPEAPKEVSLRTTPPPLVLGNSDDPSDTCCDTRMARCIRRRFDGTRACGLFAADRDR